MNEKNVKNTKISLYWHSPISYQILDLKEYHYNNVLHLIKRHFFNQDPMCRAIDLLGDEVSTQNYLKLIHFWMKDTTSLVAISSKTGRVVGTVIARINSDVDRSNTYSRIQIFNGEVFEKIMLLRNTLIKQSDAYQKLNTEMYICIYILCVHPSYESKNLKIALLEACIEMTIALEIPAIVGLFSSGIDQELVKNLNFKLLSEIRYSHWNIDNEIIFDNTGIGNYSISLMGMPTPSLDYLKKIWEKRENLINKKKIYIK